QGTLLSLQRAESVTHVSGMNCHPSLGKGIKGLVTEIACRHVAALMDWFSVIFTDATKQAA
ncbi:hypothetical protein, partial [Mesorhizobium sp. M0205]